MPRVDDERHPGVYLNSSVMPIPGINDERTLLVLQVYQCSCDCRKVLVSHGGIPGRNLCERSIRVCLDADRQAGQSNGFRVSSFIQFHSVGEVSARSGQGQKIPGLSPVRTAACQGDCTRHRRPAAFSVFGLPFFNSLLSPEIQCFPHYPEPPLEYRQLQRSACS